MYGALGHKYTDMHTHTHTNVHSRTHIYIRTNMHSCTHKHTYTYTVQVWRPHGIKFPDTNTHTHTHARTHARTNMYVCTHSHTHTHTHAQACTRAHSLVCRQGLGLHHQPSCPQNVSRCRKTLTAADAPHLVKRLLRATRW